MQLFTRLPEQQLRLARWALLIGWLLLILSLLVPAIHLPEALLPDCPPELAATCVQHRQPGNRLFWGVVVPWGIVLIGVLSHELWRRICPLAFVSQLARALGRQRTRPGRKGRPELVMVEADSWLGRHHLALQWSLLIAGLCLRLLVVNGSPLGLAILLLLTLTAALLVGWAWGGKAWCQYVCPMGPVQTVLTSLRGPLGSTAHVGTSSKITQSMCRTINSEGREQSACVACQAPCLDIDAERAFWQNLKGKRSLSWIWLSYPGLVLAFFLLARQVGAGTRMAGHSLGFLRSGAWAFDVDQPRRIWLSLWPDVPLPRLLEIPLLLSAAAALSASLFATLERFLQGLYQRQGMGAPAERAQQHTRLIASFLAINLFFWYVDPLQGLFGSSGGQLFRSLVVLATSIALFRAWGRDQATYRRESASESLRRQLRDLPGLEEALDGRSLEALSPQEVFTVVKAMPALGRRQSRATYREVIGEMLRSGRLSRATALLELEDLRQALQLEEADHHAVVRELALDQPELLERDQRQLQIDDLRREAASEQIRDLLHLAGKEVLEVDSLPPVLRERLERLQVECGLDEEAWASVLEGFGPRGELARRRLEELQERWLKEAGLTARLEELAVTDPLLRPLRQAMRMRVEEGRQGLDLRLAAAGLATLPAATPAAGELHEALELLWNDPDPDTAGWVLMLVRERDPERLGRYLQSARAGLAESPFLAAQRRGDIDPDREEFPVIAAAELFSDLLPVDLIWLARQGSLRALAAGDTLMERGSESDFMALIVGGALQLQGPAGLQVTLPVGQSVGERGVITGEPRIVTVKAGPEGAHLFVIPAEAFERLLSRSPRFGRELLAQTARRMSTPFGNDGD